MGINGVTRHTVNQQRLERAFGDMADRVQRRFEDVYYDGYPMREMLSELGYELLDHVAARSVQDPHLEDERTRLTLRTAAECLFGVLELGCCPGGDWEIPFPLTHTRLSSEEKDFDEMRDATDTVTARTWVEAFDICVASGLVRDWKRVIGLLLREDYAPMLHRNLPPRAARLGLPTSRPRAHGRPVRLPDPRPGPPAARLATDDAAQAVRRRTAGRGIGPGRR
ncbi:hypothetical protein AB0E10_40130 [Streptomyces sp. NPDC048045]|uniref:hypothetical protein n=1 Tax=Streptomyces sp. NPDC048045 TaxID=3154710 RepID=UPI003429AB5D